MSQTSLFDFFFTFWLVGEGVRVSKFSDKCTVHVAVRYMIHFYCLAKEAGFYSDVVECWTLNPADRV